ncbi:MAG: hypothetical protein JWM10_4166 [Myxococcaceae bacterium]|nr:hypothetical protein [Myxococcaceae bacterium]
MSRDTSAHLRARKAWDDWVACNEPRPQAPNEVGVLAVAALNASAHRAALLAASSNIAQNEAWKTASLAVIEWAEIVWSHFGHMPVRERLRAAEHAVSSAKDIGQRLSFDSLSRERWLRCATDWAARGWSYPAGTDDDDVLARLAGHATAALGSLASECECDPGKRESVEAEILRWAERAWALRESCRGSLVGEECVQTAVHNAISATSFAHRNRLPADSSEYRERLLASLPWCDAACSLGPTYGSTVRWKGLLNVVLSTVHMLSHHSSGAWRFHKYSIRVSELLWQCSEDDPSSSDLAAHSAICVAVGMAIGAESEADQDQHFANGLRWVERIDERYLDPSVRPRCFAAYKYAIGMLGAWSQILWLRGMKSSLWQRVIDRVRVAGGTARGTAEVDPLSLAREKVQQAKAYLAQIADFPGHATVGAAIARDAYLGQVAASVAVAAFTAEADDEFAQTLGTVLAACRWDHDQERFWRAIPGVLRYEMRARTAAQWFLWRSRLLIQDPDRGPYFKRVVRLVLTAHMATESSTLVHAHYLEVFDSLLNALWAAYRDMEACDTRVYSVGALRHAFCVIAALWWTATDNEGASELASRLAAMHGASDISLRMIDRAGAPWPACESMIDMGRRLLREACQHARDERRALVMFFDAETRLIRVTIDVYGECSAQEVDRAAVMAQYERYCELLRQLEGHLHNRLSPWPGGAQLAECLDAAGNLLLAGLRADRLTLIPHGVVHDLLAASGPRWGDRAGCCVEQSASLAFYLAARTRWMKLWSKRTGRVSVLIVVAADIALYRDVISAIVARHAAPLGDVVRYTLASSIDCGSGVRTIRGRLDSWVAARARWRECSIAEISPDVCVWLSHGAFEVNGKNVIRTSRFRLIRDDTGASDVDPYIMGQLGHAVLPVLGHPATERMPMVAEEQPLGFHLDLTRCRLVLAGACSAGRVAGNLAEDIPGLMRGFFAAGVPTVVAAAWPIPTPQPRPGRRTVTADVWETLMSALTAQGQGHSVASAVQVARSACRSEGDGTVADGGYLAVHGFGAAGSPWLASTTAAVD